jgi:hypothetical protein
MCSQDGQSNIHLHDFYNQTAITTDGNLQRRQAKSNKNRNVLILGVLFSILLYIVLHFPGLLIQFHRSQQLNQWHRRLSKTTTADPVETFLGFPVVHNSNVSTSTLVSSVHCVGENFDHNTSWMYRSCQFHNLCYNTDTQEFLLFLSPEELALQEILQKLNTDNRGDEMVTISSITRSYESSIKTLSLGTVRDPNKSIPWFPKVIADVSTRNQYLSNGFYRLPNESTLFPIRFGSNGSTLWTDFFSVFTILSMFGLEAKQPILVRTDDAVNVSTSMHAIFGILSTNIGYVNGHSPPQVVNHKSENIKSNLVCAKHGVSGLGMLAVMRYSKDGAENDGQILTHTMGRGATMITFREYILRNMGLVDTLPMQSKVPFSIVISIAFDSSAPNEWHEELRLRLQQETSSNDVVVRQVDTSDSLKRVLGLAATSMIYIVRPGTELTLAAATCLPRGATLIVLDIFDGTVAESSNDARRLERDYLESSSYFNVHWLSGQFVDSLVSGIYKNVVDIVREKLLRR